MNRVLVIRGGAIGDFLLTLPALKALRDARPQAHIEILGYKHIAVLADKRFYAQAVRSIEYGPLSSFFAKDSDPPAELATYFASFDVIISYLYDPDQVFEHNLRRCGVEHLLCGSAKIVEAASHAARQLAHPVEELGISVVDLAENIFPSPADRQFASEFLRNVTQPIIAIHPGSGSGEKNWPLENWLNLFSTRYFQTGDGRRVSAGASCSLIVVSGEADKAQTEQLEREWKNRGVRFAKNLPLPCLAAVLERSTFIGHDSGISHLAAAAGAKCVLLFGPTDPDVWAPCNKNVRVLRAPNQRLSDLEIEPVAAAITAAFSPIDSGVRRALATASRLRDAP
jgi:heptosyltransferase-3